MKEEIRYCDPERSPQRVESRAAERTVPAAGSAGWSNVPNASNASNASKLCFAGVNGRDVYNISAPFEWMDQVVLAGRVEYRETELSDIMIFAEANGTWRPLFKFPELEGMQDPCVARIGGRLVLGGVRYPRCL